MKSRIVGELVPDELDDYFSNSEPYAMPYFDNIKLKISFIEAEYLPSLTGADNALENFLELNSSDKTTDSEIVCSYYNEVLKHGYTKSLNVKAAEDIWNFVNPLEIIIDSDEKGDFYINVSCGCEWEQEHGLQLIFKNGKTLVRAGGHE